ncbi:MAG: acyltransferase, partial [Bacteroides sp.]
ATNPGMRTNNYSGNIVQFYVAAFAGIFLIMLFCKRVKRIPVVTYLGRYSVITLGIHAFALHFGGQLAARYIHNEWALALALLAGTLIICLAATPLFLKIIPQMVAQKDFIKIYPFHRI